MRKIHYLSFIAVLISMLFTFNIYAMPEKTYTGEPVRATPSIDEDYVYNYRWVWINDDRCVQFRASNKINAKADKNVLQYKYDMGLLTHWYENGEIKKRDTYAGKWSQADDGIWSFKFDDDTIPVDLTRIDGVLYAFNGYGMLIDGYNYWDDHKTAADGLVVTDNAEFNEYLKTQYLPECTSHE